MEVTHIQKDLLLFLDDEVSGTEIEFMQVYTEEELEKHKISGV